MNICVHFPKWISVISLLGYFVKIDLFHEYQSHFFLASRIAFGSSLSQVWEPTKCRIVCGQRAIKLILSVLPTDTSAWYKLLPFQVLKVIIYEGFCFGGHSFFGSQAILNFWTGGNFKFLAARSTHLKSVYSAFRNNFMTLFHAN